MKRFYCLSVMLFAFVTGYSQRWTTQAGASPISVGGLYARTANDLIVNGDKMLLFSSDAGEHWHNASIDNSKYEAVIKPSFISSNVGYSATHINTVNSENYLDPTVVLLKTEDGGRSWHAEATAGLDNLKTPSFIHFFNSNDAVLAGTTPEGTMAIYRSENGGLSWQVKFSPTDLYEVLDGQFPSASTAYLVTWGNVVKTTDGGNTWSVQSPGVDLGNYETLQRVSFSSPQDGWVSGQGALFHTIDGGANWSRIANTGYTASEVILGLHFFDATYGIVSSQSGVIKVTANAGATWEERVLGGTVVDLVFIDRQRGYAVGQYPPFLAATSDGGLTWGQNKLALPAVPQALSDISRFDLNHGCAVGGRGLILTTADGGRQWTRIANPADDEENDLNAVSYQNEQTVWAGGNSLIMKSADGGQSWTAEEGLPLFYYGYRDFFFIKDQPTGWVVGDYFKIMKYDGHSWTNHSRSGEKFLTLEAVFFINESVGWIVGEGGTILKTTDGGATWNNLNSGGVLRKFNDVFFVDENIGWVVGDNDYVLKTIDGGLNWHQQSLPHAFVGNMQGVYFSSPHRGWIVGSDEHRGAVYSTVNGGSQWTRVLPAFGASLQGLSFHDLNHGWVVSGEPGDESGGIFCYEGADTGQGDSSPPIREIDFEPLVDTLFNFDQKRYALKDSTKFGGMFIGRNNSGTEEFAEKYSIEGEAWVTGIVSYHSGTVKNPRNIAEFNVFDVDNAGMPDKKVRRKDVYFGDLDLGKNAMVTRFDKPVAVRDEFFISFNLTDYSHGGFEGDVLGVLHTANNSRPRSDIDSRNVLRVHNHDDRAWRSIRTLTTTRDYSGYLALFPIIEYKISSDATLRSLTSSAGSFTPLFTPQHFSYSIHLPHGTTQIPELTFQTNHSQATAMYEPAKVLTGGEAERTATVTVTAADGTIQTYSVLFSLAEAGLDTLKNHAPTAPIEVMKYNRAQGWGYILGHNYMFRQQYAEKYFIRGNAEVTGVITHMKGRYAHADTLSEFNVFDVTPQHIPGKRLGGKRVPYGDLNLTGEPTTVVFDNPIAVADSFYVSFNLFDYAHGGYEGDTIGMYMSRPGTRPVTDFKVVGRNVVQRHNHEYTDWVDFRTQNFTPYAVHFALYPIVKFRDDVPTAVGEQYVEQGGLRLFPAYPNPVNTILHVQYALSRPDDISVEVLDIKGVSLLHYRLGPRGEGLHDEPIDVTLLPSGMYFYVLRSRATSLGAKIIVVH